MTTITVRQIDGTPLQISLPTDTALARQYVDQAATQADRAEAAVVDAQEVIAEVTDHIEARDITIPPRVDFTDEYGNIFKRTEPGLEWLAGALVTSIDADGFRVVDDYAQVLLDATNGVGGVANGEATVSAAQSALIWSGALTSSGFTVACDIEGAGDGVTQLVVSSDAAFERREFISPAALPYETSASSVDNYRSAKLEANGLRADTPYFYRVDVDGNEGDVHTIQTAPETGDFTFVVGSCSNSNVTLDWKSVAAIDALGPLFFLHIGDLAYSDIDTDDVRLQRVENSRDMRTSIPHLADLVKSVPVIYQSDNHDAAGPSLDTGTYPGTTYGQVVANSTQAFKETVPHFAFAADATGEIGQAFSFDIAGTRFIVLDTVTFRTANTVVGSRQMAWLKARLSDAAGMIGVFIASPENWVATLKGWGQTSPAEQTELCNYIRDTAGVPPCTLLTGDMHFSAVDDGTGTDKSTGGTMPFFPQIMSSGLAANTVANSLDLDAEFSWNGSPSHFYPGSSGQFVEQFVEVTAFAAGGWTAKVYGAPYTGTTPTLLGTYNSADI